MPLALRITIARAARLGRRFGPALIEKQKARLFGRGRVFFILE
jgi:hypothetical protein